MRLAFLFLLFIPHWAWAQDFEAWAKDKEWLRLLHMQRTWGGYESLVRGPKFFLSPEGKTNPQAELKETYRLMFQSTQEDAKRVQCQFLARRDFFIRKSNPEFKLQIENCEISEEWMKKLNATEVSLIFASAYMNSAASSFGHTFLKLKNPENQGGRELLDYGINFAARTENTTGALYVLNGLFGYFPANFAMSPYHQMIKEYTHLEGRDLWEYRLNFSKEEVQRMLHHLLELEGSYFDYYFLDDNCSFLLLKVLEIARPGLELTEEDEAFVIPIDTVKRVQPLVLKTEYRPSLETEWRQRQTQLSREQREKLIQFNHSPSDELITKMNSETLSAAQYLVTLKELENHAQWKELNYKLSRERAKRGKSESTFKLKTPETSPDQSSDSSAWQIGYLNQGEKSYLLSGLQLAFHDQLSRNEGVSPFSHLEVLGFEWMSSQPKQTWLRRYRLIETLSTQSVDAFHKPLSWGLVAGADQDLESPTRLRHQVFGKIGYSYDFIPEKMRWTNLLSLGLQQDSEQNFQFTPGVDSRLWILWKPQIRSFVQYEYLRFPSHNFQRISAFQIFDLSQQLELRLGWQTLEGSTFQRVEKRISLFHNFLL